LSEKASTPESPWIYNPNNERSDRFQIRGNDKVNANEVIVNLGLVKNETEITGSAMVPATRPIFRH
jgi:hypothetical protein